MHKPNVIKFLSLPIMCFVSHMLKFSLLSSITFVVAFYLFLPFFIRGLGSTLRVEFFCVSLQTWHALIVSRGNINNNDTFEVRCSLDFLNRNPNCFLNKIKMKQNFGVAVADFVWHCNYTSCARALQLIDGGRGSRYGKYVQLLINYATATVRSRVSLWNKRGARASDRSLDHQPELIYEKMFARRAQEKRKNFHLLHADQRGNYDFQHFSTEGASLDSCKR